MWVISGQSVQGPSCQLAVPSWLCFFVAGPVPIWVPGQQDGCAARVKNTPRWRRATELQEAGSPAYSCPSALMEAMNDCFLLFSSSQEMSCLLMSGGFFCDSKLITQVFQISSDEFSLSPVLTLKVSFRRMRGLWFFEHACGKVTNPQKWLFKPFCQDKANSYCGDSPPQR